MTLYFSGSQSVVPRPEASASPGNLLRMQILRPHPRLADSEILEAEPTTLCFTGPQALEWDNHCFESILYKAVRATFFFH